MPLDPESENAYNAAFEHAEAAGVEDELEKLLPIPQQDADEPTRVRFIRRTRGFLPDEKCAAALAAAKAAAADPKHKQLLSQLDELQVPLATTDTEIRAMFIETVKALAAAAG